MTHITTRADLPLEVSGQPLDFPGLVDLMRALNGTDVIVCFDPAPDGESPPLTAVGALGEPQDPFGTGEHTLRIGNPDGHGGGVLRLRAREIRAATLSTFDGNDFFIVRIRFEHGEIRVQDADSGLP